MDNLLKTSIHVMSRRTNTCLSPRHFTILEYAYNYYQKNRVGPLFANLKRNTGADKAEINALFPHGLHSIYTWVGIPIQSVNQLCKPMAKIEVENYREVYLDHNATTYVRQEVKELLAEHFGKIGEFGNPSSSTNLGKRANGIICEARNNVANCLDVQDKEIIFVSCGSEANNLAIKGIAFAHLGKPAHIITSNIEHPSVLNTIKFLEKLGFKATYVSCNSQGIITANTVKQAIRGNTILVSIMAVNNEIGVINPIREIGEVCREASVPFMVDAIQAFGKISLCPKKDGISLMSLSGHKIYAPKGIGVLFVDEYISLLPLIHGGGQEHQIRAGTENVAYIAAFGHACKLLYKERQEENRRIKELRDYFLQKLKDTVPDYIINGSLEHRVPHNLNVGFPGIDSGSLLLNLNEIGVYVSSGSACHAGSIEDSHVIKAINTNIQSYGNIRFSFGLCTQKEDLDYLFSHLPKIIDMLRKVSDNQ